MRDEIINPFNVDNHVDDEAIPRYDIVLPSGETLYHGVQFILCNDIVEEGTPLNRQNLLSDSTSRAYGMDPVTSTPDEAFSIIRSSVGYCPKLKVDYFEGGMVHIRNIVTGEEHSYLVDSTDSVTIDILAYSRFKIWGTFQDLTTPVTELLIDTTKLYKTDIRGNHYTWRIIPRLGASLVVDVEVSRYNELIFKKTQVISPTIRIPKSGTYTAKVIYSDGTWAVGTIPVSDTEISNNASVSTDI